MATNLQQNLARSIAKNFKRKEPLNKKDLVASGGYSEITSTKHQSRTIKQKGVQEELKILGFDEYSAKKVVSEIMNNDKTEPNARLKATDQVFKVEGSYAPDKSIGLKLNIEARNSDNPEIDALIEEYDKKLKEKLTK